MPYEGEFAKYESIRRITEKPAVKDLLQRSYRRDTKTGAKPVRPKLAMLARTNRLPTLIVAIDGSHQEVPVDNGFPGAEVCYLTVASVLLDVEKMRRLDEARPVDPTAFNQLHSTDPIDAVLPGVNVVVDGCVDSQQSLRSEMYRLFETNSAFQAETLLETYEALLAHARQDTTFECPYGSQCDSTGKRAPRGFSMYKCDCSAGRTLWCTDALRFQTGMVDVAGTNGAMYAEMSQVIEHLWMINVLRSIEKKGYLSSLRRMAFVMDGPLAVFGHPAWLSQAIKTELQRLNVVAQEKNGEDILILGVEKSGMFMSHFEQIAVDPKRENEDYMPGGSAYLIDDEYIKRNIVFSEYDKDSKNYKVYGKDTYYGRKFFYKTRTGALIVGVTPFLREDDEDLTRAEVSQYPRLADALNILDDLVSARYPNAIIPLVAAHAEAAIPLNMGSRVLEKMTRELMALH